MGAENELIVVGAEKLLSHTYGEMQIQDLVPVLFKISLPFFFLVGPAFEQKEMIF